MISVQNRLPLLSGSKRLLFLAIILLAGACSPKVKPVAPVVKTEEKPIITFEQPKPVKPVWQKPSIISLLLPFGLDHLNPGAKYTDIKPKKKKISRRNNLTML